MEDHHVDRPGVEVWQHMKLTGTNRSIGLTSPPVPRGPQGQKSTAFAGQDRVHLRDPQETLSENVRRSASRQNDSRDDAKAGPALDGLVAMARGKTPDPIPNSAVKTLCADGTAS